MPKIPETYRSADIRATVLQLTIIVTHSLPELLLDPNVRLAIATLGDAVAQDKGIPLERVMHEHGNEALKLIRRVRGQSETGPTNVPPPL